MFRVLASVGSQLEAFSHEINSLLELSSTIRKQVDRLRKSRQFGREVEKELSVIYRRLTDLHHALERQAIYLTDVAGIEARRRRSRLVLRDRFDAALRLLKSAIDRSGVRVENELPVDLRSPPMFPAEVVVLFTNLLSNAVKAAGKTGRIRIRQGRGEDGASIVMENTGVAVDLNDAEKWFEPFRSTTAVPDAALGQGMGMGLTIVRSLLDEYGATARFAKPSKRFATAIEINFPPK
jgi:signal transduction histidine kinase